LKVRELTTIDQGALLDRIEFIVAAMKSER
jgi:hypothetical protein